nr:hypothetical protein [Jannaschia sp. Os4]
MRLTARDGHELACGSCGAALHDMKPLKPDAARAAARHAPMPLAKPVKLRKPKRRKPLWRKVLSEVIDEIEDIFD